MRGEHKALIDLNLDDATGEFQAVVATLGVPDKHGDILQSGFAGEQEVRMVWGHEWTEPIGKGRVYEDGDQLIAEGRFFVNVPSAREKYDLVKEMGALQEWSWGFYIHDDATEKDANGFRVIKSLPDGSPGVDIFEVSPVLIGAGVDTATIELRGAPDPDDQGVGDYKTGDHDGRRLPDEITDAARVLTSATDRTRDVMALRAEKGRDLGTETQEALTVLRASVERAAALVDEVEATAKADADLNDMWRRLAYEQLRQEQAALGLH